MMMIRILSANFIGRLPCKNIKKNLGSNLRPGCGVDPTNRQKKIEKTKQTMTRVIPALIVDYHNSMVNNEYFFLSGVYGSSLTELEPSWHRVVEKEFMFQRLSNRNWAPKKTWIQWLTKLPQNPVVVCSPPLLGKPNCPPFQKLHVHRAPLCRVLGIVAPHWLVHVSVQKWD